jgi:hypothetical protein
MNEQTTTILIDTALASGSASALDPEERKLQELVLAVRADAPAPDPTFERRRNARVAAGFPPRRSDRFGRARALLAKRPQMAAMGAAASLLIALVVALSVTNSDNGASPSSMPAVGGDTGASSGGGSSALQAAPERDASGGASTESAQKAAPSAGSTTSSNSVAAPGPLPPSPGGFVGGQNRRVERAAALTLAAPKDKLSDVGDQVIAVTDRYRGIVMRSSVTNNADEASSGSFELRIPVRNLRTALRDLSALADVKSRTENADDVTASFVSARTRLEELNAERRGLLRRLEQAPTDQATAAIRARIRLVNAQIEAQTRTLTEMRRRTSYAAVSVMLESKNGDSGGSGGISDGARDLRDSLVDAANISLRVLGIALPIGLVLALMWLIGGRFNRRRREAVLD